MPLVRCIAGCVKYLIKIHTLNGGVCVRINITQNGELFQFLINQPAPGLENTWLHNTDLRGVRWDKITMEGGSALPGYETAEILHSALSLSRIIITLLCVVLYVPSSTSTCTNVHYTCSSIHYKLHPNMLTWFTSYLTQPLTDQDISATETKI